MKKDFVYLHSVLQEGKPRDKKFDLFIDFKNTSNE